MQDPINAESTMRQRTLLLTNPGSRSGDEDIARAVKSFERDGEVRQLRPDDPASLPEAIEVHGAWASRIVLGGGDGTVNLALDALLDCDRPLGLLPLGTANDLARSLDIPEDLDKAVALIRDGGTRRIDVARANGVSFVNAIGMGLGPQMTRMMDTDSKSRLGVLAYLLGILRALKAPPSFHARLSSEQQDTDGDFLQITVANGIHYGGGMTIADDAKLDDGLLDVLLIRRQSRLAMLGNALRLRTGQVRASDTMTHWRCKQLNIRTDESLDVTADGEFLTDTPVDCEALPGALEIFAR
ncbi:diacylglycerol/lipid kinase family protein [Wenzhouxiangella marina]|uniref:Diacylglycerol kinase catalytic region n=1 Tax=Wenzhouxiangella marina TaxID=1579979 RepID=A0A0K0XXE6_9GAMM|nr:YegS/Rv2252/BmrU family lipid kinase [Wenzhouxiangella marina]AKS42350.1 Diacylglycerol kinase catalytic region [Wenzhouxiangella marina]MBB6085877.1 YegS/Rv2252/BmrU family lipid kinase [Wenzhouxiangella marina]